MPTLQMNSASAGARYNHKFSPLSVASLDYGEAPAMRVIETVKSNKWNQISGKGFLRLAPADFPAYGRAYLKSAAFFIPLYQVIEYADAQRQGQALWHGKDTTRPGLMSHTINTVFLGGGSSTLPSDLCTVVDSQLPFVSFPDDSNSFDFFIPISQNGSLIYRICKLTSKGRRYYKLLCSLGYDFRGYIQGSANGYSDVVNTGNINLDATPLFAYAKMYCDYFMNIHMYNSSQLVEFLQAVREGNDFSLDSVNYFYKDRILTPLGLRWLLDQFLLPWQSNLYLNAWNSLNDPIGVSGVNTKSPNVDGPVSFILPSLSIDGTPRSTNTLLVNADTVSIGSTPSNSNALTSLTPSGINTLYAFYQFVRRNNLAGSESAKQAFARLGIKGNDFDSYFVRKLFEGSQQIDFSAVMSNSNTVVPDSEQGSYLGAYAGVGLCSLDFNYTYESTDYGYIIHVAWIQFDALQLHGFDPMVLKKNYLDYWTPEFDGKAQRAIPLAEITQTKYPSDPSQGNDVTPYGFINLYDEYRNMRDLVLGDFRCGFARNYLFARDLSYYRNTKATHSNSLLQPQTNRVQYFNRDGQNDEFTNPFQFDVTAGDRFYLQIIWNIDLTSPILSDELAADLNGPGSTPIDTDSNPS